ncbi:hypothetical protein CTI12_AA179770 [Artemisia annua]|uniref:RNA-directed DNA polymerase, eukaryota, Reverse transcriptase zinc-binding domain protein n=1 Tax=Artemisia annua TaxID=35608 RepID=A0A2U1P642_ARTAN|nr:hypothetical protein CTI12_AA179770 [Artemisia annua]
MRIIKNKAKNKAKIHSSFCSDRKVVSEVKGLGTDDKVDWVRELGVAENPIVFGLQETKLKEVDENFVRRLWNGDDLGFAQVNAIGSSGGLITMWNASIFTGTHAVGEVDFLAVVGKWNGVEGVVGLLNVYGPRDEYQRARLYEYYSSIIRSIAWIHCKRIEGYPCDNEIWVYKFGLLARLRTCEKNADPYDGTGFTRSKMGNKKQKQKVVLPPMLPPDVPEDDIEFSDEDLDFVKSNRDYAGFVSNLDTQSITRSAVFCICCVE